MPLLSYQSSKWYIRQHFEAIHRKSSFVCLVSTLNRKSISMGSEVMRYAPRSERAVNFWLRLQPVNVLKMDIRRRSDVHIYGRINARMRSSFGDGDKCNGRSRRWKSESWRCKREVAQDATPTQYFSRFCRIERKRREEREIYIYIHAHSCDRLDWRFRPKSSI